MNRKYLYYIIFGFTFILFNIVQENIRDYDQEMTAGSMLPIYRFGDGVVDGEDLKITNELISIPSIKSGISLQIKNPFPDMTD